ncbi:MAG: hypothetical protein GY950_01885, partial [bacterium]|nr:hypothetical protein [bacterium]
MKFLDICTDIVTVTKNKNISQIYDVDLQAIDRLKDMGFSSVECHIVLYPYSRKVTTEHFEFTPFEEYVNDILSHQRSAYTKIKNHFCNLFGLIVGIMIAVFSYIFKTSDLFSIESIVSILGAYFVGKELWGDIEDLVINMTRDWRIRYRERYYFYRLEKHTTLSQYSHLAKKRRYGKSAMLPEKMDFNQKRNSETIRLYFNMRDLKSVKDTSAHILSIRL